MPAAPLPSTRDFVNGKGHLGSSLTSSTPLYMNRGRPRREKCLQILQANVGRGGPAHEIALQTAWDNQIDVVLIQEPWVSALIDRRIPKKQPAYRCFTPIEDW